MTQLAYTGNYALASRAPRELAASHRLRHLGYGLPAGIGAKLGAPQRPGLVLVGDGGFLTPRRNWPPPARNWTVRWWCSQWNNDALGQIPRRHARPGHRAGRRAAAQPRLRPAGPRLRLRGAPAAGPERTGARPARRLRAPGVTLIELRHACAR
ncbi:thiamine pyrophosphate-dependent enzyme [Pseudomonas aeruginosa]